MTKQELVKILCDNVELHVNPFSQRAPLFERNAEIIVDAIDKYIEDKIDLVLSRIPVYPQYPNEDKYGNTSSLYDLSQVKKK